MKVNGAGKTKSEMKKTNQRFNRFVPPGHPEDVGDDGGEEGFEEQPAVLLAHRGLDHTKCLHLDGFCSYCQELLVRHHSY